MSRSLNAQFIQRRFGRDYHQHVLHMKKLGIYTGLPKYTPKLSHTCQTFYISKGPFLPCHINVSTENLDPGIWFHLEFSFSNKVYLQNVTAAPTIVYATTSHLFGFTFRYKRPPLQLIKKSIQFYLRHGYKRYTFRVDEGGELSISADFMQPCIGHRVIF